MTKCIFPLLAALLTLGSCSSDKFDYRNKYTGNFKIAGTLESSAIPGEINSEVQIEDKATVDFAEDDSKLLIIVEKLEIRVLANVDHDGKLTFGSSTLGSFADKDHFDFAQRMWSPAGDYTAYNLHGTRK